MCSIDITFSKKSLLIPLGIYIILEFVLKSVFRSISHDIIVSFLSESREEKGLVLQLLSMLGNLQFLYMLNVFLLLFTTDKWKALNKIINFFVAQVVVNTIQLLFAEDRPYFMYNDINPIQCNKSLGHPSTHAFLSVYFYLSFFKSFCFERIKTETKGTNNVPFLATEPPEQYSIKFPNILLPITIITLNSVTRILGGAHYIHQMLLGIWLGFYTLYYLELSTAKPFKKILEMLRDDYDDDVNLKQKWPKIFFVLFLILMLPGLCLCIIDAYRINIQSWDDITELACNLKSNQNSIIRYHQATFLKLNTTWIIFFLQLQAAVQPYKYIKDEGFEQKTFFKNVSQSLIGLFIIVLIHEFFENISISNNVYFLFFIQYMIRNFIQVYYVSFVHSWICNKLGI